MARCIYFTRTINDPMSVPVLPIPPKIPRPPNAFMIYANQNRKKTAMLHPTESNKEISKRLGNSWRSLEPPEKERYFDLAKKVDADHKRKYPDYVYNPKEARIRKAMREASRDRNVGAAPMPPPRGGRRSQPWSPNPEEQLMMTPDMRTIGSPMCATPTFPNTSGNGSFMQPMQNYAKLVHVMPPNTWMSSSPGGYLQAHSYGEFQHQPGMWHQYSEPIRNSIGATYGLAPPPMHHFEPSSYQPPTEITAEISQEKSKIGNISNTKENHSSNENISPNVDGNKMLMNDADKEDVSNGRAFSEPNTQSTEFVCVFPENGMMQNSYEKFADRKMKKNVNAAYLSASSIPAGSNFCDESFPKMLDPTLEFVLSPPPCPLTDPLPSDCSNDIDYQQDYIRKCFQNINEYGNMQMPQGDNFNFVTVPFSGGNEPFTRNGNYLIVNNYDLTFNSANDNDSDDVLNLSISQSSDKNV